jgi:hypothetical protein
MRRRLLLGGGGLVAIVIMAAVALLLRAADPAPSMGTAEAVRASDAAADEQRATDEVSALPDSVSHGADSHDLAAQRPRTTVVTVVAMRESGEPAPGYTVTEQDGPVDCDAASPAAVGADVVACSPSAASADVCWVRPDRQTLLCGGRPWEKSLIRVTSTLPVPATPKPATAEPWGLELADGAKCRLRNGGAWGGRADGYVGMYWCDRADEFVLIPGDDGTHFVDRSTPTWTVHVGDLGDPGQTLPAPRTVDVVTAYFAGFP